MINIEAFVCPICGNKDIKYIGKKNGHFYCRKCISFRGEEVSDNYSYPTKAPIYLDYDLSEDQKRLSNQIVENYKKGINTLVHAITGAGKTEIVLAVIKYAIMCGDKVGFAIPRKDVVIEIYERFKTIFKQNRVISLYGGHTNEKEGDLIILTTHQLFRYHHYFDLLIMDEIDAFPFKGSDILKSFFYRAIKSKFVIMSATPSEELIKAFSNEGYSLLELYSRFHTYPLPVPKIIVKNKFMCFYYLIDYLSRFKREKKPVMVFTPTIEMCEKLYTYISLFVKGGWVVHSKREDRSESIDRFRKGIYHFLVTTAVLERGVTVKNAQVIVFHAEHMIYNQYTLVQISGRVGRKKDAPEGEVIYLATKSTDEMEKSVESIKRANKNLQALL